MNLLNFAAQHWDDITAAGALITGLLWHRGKKLRLDDLWDTLMQLGRQVLPKLLNDPHLYDDAYVRAKLNTAIWAGLERLKVPHSQTVEKLVDEVVEHLHGELAEKLWNANLGAAVDKLQKTSDGLKAATAAP
jgi:hypothetical protein